MALKIVLKQDKIVVDFVSKKKRLILNKTQAAAFVAIAGDDSGLRQGGKMFLSPTPASNGKFTVTVLGVSEEVAEAA